MEQGGEGHCLCGAVRFAFAGPVNWAGYCHCESCRRNCAAPVTAFIGVPKAAFQWTAQAPSTYRHSVGTGRHFCSTCGTPMAYTTDRFAGEIHLYTATLTDPTRFTPTQHFHFEEHLAWMHIHDDLQRHASNSLNEVE